MARGHSHKLNLVGLILIASLVSLACRAQEIDPAARAALPEKNKQSGVLEVATSLQWPPFDFKSESGQPDGIDLRLVTALAKRLSLTPKFTDVKFPAIVPGVATGRFDIGVDQLAETPERQKVVQFVDYYGSALGLLVRKGTMGIDVTQLCGHTLALTQGSSQVAVAQRVSAQCVADGKKAIGLLYYPDSADTYMAVANGRGDGFLTDQAVGVYIARQNDKLEMLPGTLQGTRSLAGIVIAKDNNALAKALRLALLDMMHDGSYQKLLAEYGVADASLTPTDLEEPK
jgi:polar amino acid transport system substrate-binding protein